MNFDVERVREEYPAVTEGIYFDNAATMHRPTAVMQAVMDFYTGCGANPHGGIYDSAIEAYEMVDEARETVARFIGAEKTDEIVFTKNATESLNMAAVGVMSRLSSDDMGFVSVQSHHSNLLPWTKMSQQRKIRLGMVEDWKEMTAERMRPNMKFAAVGMMSNVTGEVVDVKKVARAMKKTGGTTVVDAAQAVAHMKVDVQKMGADILAFSGHKIGAPMGVGVLYGKYELIERMEPTYLGGGMVDGVFEANGTLGLLEKRAPERLEAGTLNVGGIVGLSVAIKCHEMVRELGGFEYVNELGAYLKQELRELSEVEIIGGKHGIVAFNIRDVHAHDVAQILNEEGIFVRAGYHCAQPLLEHLGVGPCVRASLSYYNTYEEVDNFMDVIKTVRRKMGR